MYKNLTTTNMEKLLNLSKPAYDFVNESQFKLCLWPEHFLEALGLAIKQNKLELVKLFKPVATWRGVQLWGF